MESLFVGVGQVRLYFRHAQSLKDKRQVMKSLIQKLKNLGFSATECDNAESVKQGCVGYTFAGHGYGHVERTLAEGKRLFLGNFEVVDTQEDIFDYSQQETDIYRKFEEEGEYP